MSVSQVTVRRGDTLTDIAARHDTSLDAMRLANPQLKNIDLLQPWQVLSLPQPAATSPSPAARPESAGALPSAPVLPAAPRPVSSSGLLPPPASKMTQAQSRSRAAATEQMAAARMAPIPTKLEAMIRRGGVLREGAGGAEVLDLQRFLGMKRIEQDGDFGPATRQALEAFQRRHGLSADGEDGVINHTLQ